MLKTQLCVFKLHLCMQIEGTHTNQSDFTCQNIDVENCKHLQRECVDIAWKFGFVHLQDAFYLLIYFRFFLGIYHHVLR